MEKEKRKKYPFEIYSVEELLKRFEENEKVYDKNKQKKLSREEEIFVEAEAGYCINSEDLEDD